MISKDSKLSEIFKQKPTAAHRKSHLSDYLMKNDIAYQQFYSHVSPCGKWKLCPKKIQQTSKLNITEKIKGTGNCNERGKFYGL